jgi:hypothetical protein
MMLLEYVKAFLSREACFVQSVLKIICTLVRGSLPLAMEDYIATAIGKISVDVTKAVILSLFSPLEIALEDVAVLEEVFQLAEVELALALA